MVAMTIVSMLVERFRKGVVFVSVGCAPLVQAQVLVGPGQHGGHSEFGELKGELGNQLIGEEVVSGPDNGERSSAIFIDGRAVNPGRLIARWVDGVVVASATSVVEQVGLSIVGNPQSVTGLVILRSAESLSTEGNSAGSLAAANDIEAAIKRLLMTGLFAYVEPDWVQGVDGPREGGGLSGQAGSGRQSEIVPVSPQRYRAAIAREANRIRVHVDVGGMSDVVLQYKRRLADTEWVTLDSLGIDYEFRREEESVVWSAEASDESGFYRLLVK